MLTEISARTIDEKGIESHYIISKNVLLSHISGHIEMCFSLLCAMGYSSEKIAEYIERG